MMMMMVVVMMMICEADQLDDDAALSALRVRGGQVRDVAGRLGTHALSSHEGLQRQPRVPDVRLAVLSMAPRPSNAGRPTRPYSMKNC